MVPPRAARASSSTLHHVVPGHGGPSPEALQAQRHRRQPLGVREVAGELAGSLEQDPRRAGITAPDPTIGLHHQQVDHRLGSEGDAIGLRGLAEPLDVVCRLCESKVGRVGSSGRHRPSKRTLGTIKGDGRGEVACDLGRVCTAARGVPPLEGVTDPVMQSAASPGCESLVEGLPEQVVRESGSPTERIVRRQDPSPDCLGLEVNDLCRPAPAQLRQDVDEEVVAADRGHLQHANTAR